MIKLPDVIQMADAGDCLHRGDLVFWRPDVGNRGWQQKLIIDFQRNREMLEYPLCEVSHVLTITAPEGGNVPGAAAAWQGWEMVPWRGRAVDVRKDYHGGQLIVMRYEGWEDDAARYEYCTRVIAECQHWYSFTGNIHVALGLFPQLPGGRFCSQAAESPAEALGVDGGEGFVLNYPASRVSPGRLASSPLLRIVAVVYAK
jgi:hypothetical protein